MDKERTCENCRFFSEFDIEDGGWCRRHPPRLSEAILHSIFKDEPHEGDRGLTPDEGHLASQFPWTYQDSWCGEHQPNNQENANG